MITLISGIEAKYILAWPHVGLVVDSSQLKENICVLVKSTKTTRWQKY